MIKDVRVAGSVANCCHLITEARGPESEIS